jgi:hypothetical protein
MNPPPGFTAEETTLMADQQFFRAKAQIMAKVRRMLEDLQRALKTEVKASPLLTPPDFDGTKSQLVKGEHLEGFPYQYLDCPKHFVGPDKFTFRTLFWWGHHVVFALLLEGGSMKRYKKNLVDRFHAIAGQGLELSQAPTLWEWKGGEGYTLPITHDRKARMAAVLAERSALKIMRFVPMDDPRLRAGDLSGLGRETFQAMRPIVAP